MNNNYQKPGWSLWRDISFSFILLAGMAFSCTYDTLEMKPVETPDTVSFSNDVIPVFETNCAYAGCHNAGGIPPDLTEANAYFELTTFGYIEQDTALAEQSLLYQKIDIGGSMEKYASDNDRALILKWIKQGAQNN
jgi:hypothetical protein